MKTLKNNIPNHFTIKKVKTIGTARKSYFITDQKGSSMSIIPVKILTEASLLDNENELIFGWKYFVLTREKHRNKDTFYFSLKELNSFIKNYFNISKKER